VGVIEVVLDIGVADRELRAVGRVAGIQAELLLPIIWNAVVVAIRRRGQRTIIRPALSGRQIGFLLQDTARAVAYPADDAQVCRVARGQRGAGLGEDRFVGVLGALHVW